MSKNKNDRYNNKKEIPLGTWNLQGRKNYLPKKNVIKWKRSQQKTKGVKREYGWETPNK